MHLGWWKAFGKKKRERKWCWWVFKPLSCCASKSNKRMFLMTCTKTMVRTIITRQLWEEQGGALLHKGFIAFCSVYPNSCFTNRAGYCSLHVDSLGDTWSPKDMIQLLLAGYQSWGGRRCSLPELSGRKWPLMKEQAQMLLSNKSLSCSLKWTSCLPLK